MFNTDRVLTLRGLDRAFITKNGLNMGGTYESHFGEHFMKDVEALGPGKTWVDMGAGRGSALLSALQQRKFRAIGVGYVHPERDALTRDRHDNPNYRYVEGDIYEHSLAELGGRGKVNLITDLYGPSYYSPQWRTLLQMYGDLLKPGGHVYFTHMFGSPYSGRIAVRAKSGEEVDHLTLFSNIRGFRVVEDNRDKPYQERTLMLERTDEPLEIPAFESRPDQPQRLDLLGDVKTVALPVVRYQSSMASGPLSGR